MTALPCPGCGARFEPVDGAVHPYMESSPACWAAYGHVLEREYSDRSLSDIHRLSVDAYAVQHPGTPSRQSIQSVGLHLLRLLLQLERSLPAAEANQAMLALGKHKKRFFWLEPPASRGTVTVADVLSCTSATAHKAAVRAWAQSAFSAWAMHRPALDEWLSLAAGGR